MLEVYTIATVIKLWIKRHLAKTFVIWLKVLAKS